MADKELSAITAASALSDADTLLVTQGGSSRKATVLQFKNYASGLVRIDQEVLGLAAASIDFASLPATYEDLIVVIQGQTSNAAVQSLRVRFNGDTGSNYDYSRWNRFLAVSSNTTSAVAAAFIEAGSLNSSASTSRASIATIEIPNYRRTSFFKMMQATNAVSDGATAGGQYPQLSSGLWRSTAAITQVTLTLAAGDFTAGTVATLYGRL